jgi:23S rRNA (guanine745-N1)-methyltransferase
VRDCGLLLERRGRTYVCARRHTYDLARSGYLNLLQPTDRRSLTAGDARDAIVARARLLALSVGASILEHVTARVVTHLPADAVAVDLGSGAGELLGAIYNRRPDLTGIGIDLSTAAAEHAARRYPHVLWVVANADRRLPLLDRAVDVVVSLHGRRNPEESSRVLTSRGVLIVVVPAADDLVELREHLHGAALERERAAAVIAEHADRFTVLEHTTVRERHRVNADGLRDLLRGTYRGARISTAERLDTLPTLDVTIASEVLVLQPLVTIPERT